MLKLKKTHFTISCQYMPTQDFKNKLNLLQIDLETHLGAHLCAFVSYRVLRNTPSYVLNNSGGEGFKKLLKL